MMQQKFGDGLRSKTDVVMEDNEMLTAKEIKS